MVIKIRGCALGAFPGDRLSSLPPHPGEKMWKAIGVKDQWGAAVSMRGNHVTWTRSDRSSRLGAATAQMGEDGGID